MTTTTRYLQSPERLQAHSTTRREPGVVRARFARSNGALIVLRQAEPQVDATGVAPGAWHVECRDHGTDQVQPHRTAAKAACYTPATWCAGCATADPSLLDGKAPHQAGTARVVTADSARQQAAADRVAALVDAMNASKARRAAQQEVTA